MAAERRRRCEFCAVLFRPDPRVGKRQRACSKSECQEARRVDARRGWQEQHPDYFRGRAVKHATYRADVAAGRRTPVPRPSATRPEQDERLRQVTPPQDVPALLPALREQDEISPQVQLLLGLAVSLPTPSAVPEQDEIATRLAAWESLGRRALASALGAPTATAL